MFHQIKRLIRKTFNFFGYEIMKLANISIGFDLHGWVNTLNIESIIDIGSNEGQFIQAINAVLPGKKIYAFEPIKSVFDKLLINTKGINVTAFNVGLSDKSTNLEINISQNLESSSVLDMEDVHKRIYPESEYVRKETIKLERLDDIIDVSKIQKNILIKIDVQGYENMVISGGGNTISNASAVIIEFAYEPIYKGQWLFDETFRYFTANGFRFIGLANQATNDVIGVPVFGDALFVKESLAKKLYS